MLLFLCAGLAAASDATILGWIQFSNRSTSDAVATAHRALDADPTDLEAHRLYVSASMQERHRREAVQATYTDWQTAEPDHLGARLGLAQTAITMQPDGWCETMEALIGERSPEPSEAYQQLRVLLSAASDCENIDRDALTAELLAAAEAPSAAGPVVGWAAYHRVSTGGVDADTPAMLRSALETDPGRIDQLARMLWTVKVKGRGKDLKAAQGVVLAEALVLAETDDRGRRWLSQRALAHAGHPLAETLAAELEIDAPSSMQAMEWSDLHDTIYEADKKPTHALALAALDAMGAPEDEAALKFWLERRATRLEALDDQAELHVVSRELAALSPDDPDIVNDWAWGAAEQGVELEPALAAIEHALAVYAPVWMPSLAEHEAWAEYIRWERSMWLDTQGWLLHRLGREEEARDAVGEALMLSEDPTLHGHMAEILSALDDNEGASAHARTALVLDTQGEVDTEVRVIAESLWMEHGSWHPGGLDGWVAQQQAAAAAETEPVAADDELGSMHPLLGQALPLTTVGTLDGGTLDLSDLEGPLVVDVWATWCGPCVAGMPHLQEVADAYADQGVRVVGLSVDAKKAPAVRFFRGAPEMAYDLGWVGASGFETLQIDGIPSLFVVDQEGTVQTYLSGYGGASDTRLEEAIEAMLAER